MNPTNDNDNNELYHQQHGLVKVNNNANNSNEYGNPSPKVKSNNNDASDCCGGGATGTGSNSDLTITMTSKVTNNEIAGQHTALPPLTPTQKDLCHKAIQLFENGDYAECSTIFADILSHRLSDYRLSHNLIVSSFWQNHCKDLHGTFLPQLLGILDEASISLENICDDDDEGIVHPVLLHNLAVVYYFDGQYEKSFDLVDKLLKSLPHSSSILIKRLKLLKVNLLVQLQNYDEALLEIQRIEKKGSSCTSYTRPSDSRNSSTEDIGELINSSNDEATDNDERNPVPDYSLRFKSKLQECKIRCHLCMKNLSSARKEYKLYGAMLSATRFGCGVNDGRKAKAFNYSAQIRPTGINFKAYHNYLKGNIREGRNTLNLLLENYTESHFMETGDNLNVIYNNNVGCCQYALGKPIVSAWFFQKASQEISKPEYKDRHNLPLHCLGFNRKFEIMYNFGVSLLNANNLTEAFNCLSICSKQYPDNPRLWLRLAECCIHISKSFSGGGNSDANSNPSAPDSIASSVNIEKPTPSLDYGLYCVEKGIKLMGSKTISGVLYVPPSNPLRDITEINTLREALYCAAAYISLSLKHYQHCIKHCWRLITIGHSEEVPNAYIYLAKMYCGKALLKQKQDQPNMIQALEIYKDIKDFDPRHYWVQNYDNNIRAYTSSPCCRQNASTTEVTPNISPISSSSGGSQRFHEYKPASDWYPNSELTAQTDVVHNHIVTLTKLGQLTEAAQLTESWKSRLLSTGTIPPKEFTYLEAYVSFATGNIEQANQLMALYASQNQ